MSPHGPGTPADSDRLAALRDTGLLDLPREARFDRITDRVSEALRVPVALVSLLDENRQFFKACTELGDRSASERGGPPTGLSTEPKRNGRHPRREG